MFLKKNGTNTDSELFSLIDEAVMQMKTVYYLPIGVHTVLGMLNEFTRLSEQPSLERLS